MRLRLLQTPYSEAWVTTIGTIRSGWLLDELRTNVTPFGVRESMPDSAQYYASKKNEIQKFEALVKNDIDRINALLPETRVSQPERVSRVIALLKYFSGGGYIFEPESLKEISHQLKTMQTRSCPLNA